MAQFWYTLHSHPNKEDLLWRQVESLGFEAFYPKIRAHPVNPRARKIKPYFPGYLFVRVDLELVGHSVFQWMPYSTGLVSFGGEPSTVPDNFICTLKKRIQYIYEVGEEIFDGLHQGDAIDIEYGPFAGYEAIFDSRLSGSERVRVLLKMLNSRNVPLELNADSLRKKIRKY